MGRLKRITVCLLIPTLILASSCRTKDGQIRRCLKSSLCSKVVDFDYYQDYDIDSVYGFCPDPTEVCCLEMKDIYSEDDGKIVDLPEPPECGVRIKQFSRIVKGKDARLGDYPWMAALGYRNYYTNETLWHCGGALISRKHILTAAHCILDNLFAIRLGDLNLHSDVDGASYIDVNISGIIKYEEYSSGRLLNDIAIIKLANLVTHEDIIPICLPFEETRTFEGYQLTVAGWGKLDKNGNLSDTLKYTNIEAKPLSYCRKSLSDYSRRVITGNNICGSGYQTDSCEGDSGGPLMWLKSEPDNIFDVYYLVGIVSWGISCGEHPAIYTRITSYLEWIDNHLD